MNSKYLIADFGFFNTGIRINPSEVNYAAEKQATPWQNRLHFYPREQFTRVHSSRGRHRLHSYPNFRLMKDRHPNSALQPPEINILKKQSISFEGKNFTVIYRDLDHLFGRWSENEFTQINRSIDSERIVDNELWYGVSESNLQPIRSSIEFRKFLKTLSIKERCPRRRR
jgi:hypothetical protein